MRRRSKRLVAVAVCSSLCTSCAIPLGGPRASASPVVATTSGATRPANEVLLTARGEPPALGKLAGIDGEDVTFLPSPYWNAAARSLKVDDIVTIHVTDRKSHVGRVAGLSFTTGFVLTGGICGAAAKYNNDYTDCLLGAGVLGAVAGLLGLAVGGLADLSQTKTYDFDRMKPTERREAVQRLVAH
jgi:hypothetical protein